MFLGVAGIAVTVFVSGALSSRIPPTVSFYATPSTVTLGSPTRLTWTSTGAESCRAADGWGGEKSLYGSEAITAATTTTYTLICRTGTGVETTKSIMVTVVPKITIDFFTVIPSEWVVEGQAVELSWSSAGASFCEASSGWSGRKSASGKETVYPVKNKYSNTAQFTLKCDDGHGNKSEYKNIVLTFSGTPDYFDAVRYSVKNGTMVSVSVEQKIFSFRYEGEIKDTFIALETLPKYFVCGKPSGTYELKAGSKYRISSDRGGGGGILGAQLRNSLVAIDNISSCK